MALNVYFYSLNDEEYDTELHVTLGPFEFVQMTYDMLREDKGGLVIAVFDHTSGDWVVDDVHYSDFEVTMEG